MTDITNFTPILARPARSLSLKLPKLAVSATIGAMARLIGHAFEMAYVAPFQAPGQKRDKAPEVLPDGRDPNW